MRNRLVIKVDKVADKRDNGNASRDLQSIVGNHASVRGVVYIVGEVLIEDCREDERHYFGQYRLLNKTWIRTCCDEQKTVAGLGDSWMETLDLVLDATYRTLVILSTQHAWFALTSNEAKSQAQQDIGQDRTENSSLDDKNIRVANRLLQQHHEQDDLHDRAKGGLEHNSEGFLRHLARQLLAGETQ